MELSRFSITIITLSLLIPGLVSADRGMMVWPPLVSLEESSQNAIVAWSGEEEIIILSNDIKSEEKATVLGILPLPSNPTSIEEGDFASFEKLVEIMNKKIKEVRKGFLGLEKGGEAFGGGIEITFQKKIGAHDLTVVKVNNLDYFLNWVKEFAENKNLGKKKISQEFKEGVANYLKRGIIYFVFDVIEVAKEAGSIKPLIYRFPSDSLYYPLKITATSDIGESSAHIHLFFITEKEIPDAPFRLSEVGRWFESSYPVELTSKELEEISPQLSELFKDKVTVKKVSFYGNLGGFRDDVILYPAQYWEKDLKLGNWGEEVKALQKILINAEVWDSEIGATGYFGSITSKALADFQEKYRAKILEPLQLKSGTGYFGKMTRNYLKKLSLEVREKEEKIKWRRNLTVGMRGEDVTELQEILIKEGVWEEPKIGTTGFFGPITQKAVIKFQEKYSEEILKPLNLDKGTGFVGPLTRSFLNKYKKEFLNKYKEELGFCGSSTYGPCRRDEDCRTGGCSGQVCESKLEEPVITTCEWRDCYNAKKYGLSCRCVEGKCQWAK